MKKEAYSTNRVFGADNDFLTLTFPLADAGTRVFAWNDRLERLHLSTNAKKAKKNCTVLTVKQYGRGRKYLDLHGLIDKEGFYTIYRRNVGNNEEFIVVKENEEDVDDRVKMSHDRSFPRVTSNGSVVIPTNTRNALRNDSGKFKFEVNVSKAEYSVRITPFDPIADAKVPQRKDLVKQYGTRFLEKLGSFSYVLADYEKGHLRLPSAFVRLLEDVDYGVAFNVNYENPCLTISKKNFFCDECGALHTWQLGGKVALHACPHCAKNLKRFKRFIPDAPMSDSEAIHFGNEGVDEAMNFLREMNARITAQETGLKNRHNS